jgi:hypothetical protein
MKICTLGIHFLAGQFGVEGSMMNKEIRARNRGALEANHLGDSGDEEGVLCSAQRRTLAHSPFPPPSAAGPDYTLYSLSYILNRHIILFTLLFTSTLNNGRVFFPS